MGIDIYIQFTGGPEGTELRAFGSGDDLVAALGWAAGIPRVELLAKLHELFDTSTVTGTMDLSIELEMAMEEFPPSEEVRVILDHFLEMIGTGDDQETAHIGDPCNDDAFVDECFPQPNELEEDSVSD